MSGYKILTLDGRVVQYTRPTTTASIVNDTANLAAWAERMKGAES